MRLLTAIPSTFYFPRQLASVMKTTYSSFFPALAGLIVAIASLQKVAAICPSGDIGLGVRQLPLTQNGVPVEVRLELFFLAGYVLD